MKARGFFFSQFYVKNITAKNNKFISSFFETGIHHATQAHLKLTILPSPEYWDGHGPPHLAFKYYCLFVYLFWCWGLNKGLECIEPNPSPFDFLFSFVFLIGSYVNFSKTNLR
jgi:hypothetical protein